MKCGRKQSFVSQKLFSKNFIGIHEIKPFLALNKPIYVGFSILDLSKYLMYEFYHRYIKNKIDAKLLLTHRDSLVYQIKTEVVYEDFYEENNLFELSDYLWNSKLFDPVNKKVIGKMEDEFKEKIISEFVGLKLKMYLLNGVDDEEVTKAKGVNIKIRHQEFVDVMFNKKVIRHSMKKIQTKLHRIGTYDICKISLSCFDDKIYVLDDGVDSLANFYKDIVLINVLFS